MRFLQDYNASSHVRETHANQPQAMGVPRVKQTGLYLPLSRVYGILRNRGVTHSHTKEAVVFIAAIVEDLVREFVVATTESAIAHKNRNLRPKHVVDVLNKNALFQDLLGSCVVSMSVKKHRPRASAAKHATEPSTK